MEVLHNFAQPYIALMRIESFYPFFESILQLVFAA